MTEEQHDDHCWLMVGGSMWAIEFMRWPIIFLWRGYWPNIENSILDVSEVRWDEYISKAVSLLAGDGSHFRGRGLVQLTDRRS
jgi:hypothetical protein